MRLRVSIFLIEKCFIIALSQKVVIYDLLDVIRVVIFLFGFFVSFSFKKLNDPTEDLNIALPMIFLFYVVITPHGKIAKVDRVLPI